MSDIIIIGNGVAGDSAATVIARSEGKFNVKIFTKEEHPFYQRTRLGEVLSGKSSPEDLILHDTQWYEGREIDLHLKTTITEIESKRKVVRTRSDDTFSYDKLLLATGAKPLLPPIESLNRGNVFSIRTLKDVQKIRSNLSQVEKAVVIGGGLLGLESAFSLNQRGLDVTVVEALPLIMGKQLDRTGSNYVQSRLESEGIKFELDAKVRELAGGETITSAVLDDGKKIKTDLTIISAGVSPRTKLASGAGLKTNRGILVDENLRTSQSEIFAAGDAIEQNGRCYGIWPPALEQGKVAGKNLIGADEEYDGSLSYFKLKVASIDMISAGVKEEDRAEKVLVDEKKAEKNYKKFFLNEDGELIGAILVGDKQCYPTVLNGLRNRRSFTELNKEYQLVD